MWEETIERGGSVSIIELHRVSTDAVTKTDKCRLVWGETMGQVNDFTGKCACHCAWWLSLCPEAHTQLENIKIKI